MASRKLKQRKNPSAPRYVSWGVIPSRPLQMIKKVWGLGAEKEHCIDITLIGDNPILMDMDAPAVLPAGSMLREETVYLDTIYFAARQRVVLR